MSDVLLKISTKENIKRIQSVTIWCTNEHDEWKQLTEYSHVLLPTDKEIDETCTTQGKILKSQNKSQDFIGGFITGWYNAIQWILSIYNLKK